MDKRIAQKRKAMSEVLIQMANELDDMLDVTRADQLTLMANELQQEYIPKPLMRVSQSQNDEHSRNDEYTNNFNYSSDEFDSIDPEEEEYMKFIHGDDDEEDVDYDMRLAGREVEVQELDSIAEYAKSLREGKVQGGAKTVHGITFGEDPYSQFMKAREGADGGRRSMNVDDGYREMQARLADRADRADRKSGKYIEQREPTAEDIAAGRILEARQIYDTLMRKPQLSDSDEKRYRQVTRFLSQHDPAYTGM